MINCICEFYLYPQILILQLNLDYEQIQFPQGARNIRIVELLKHEKKEFRKLSPQPSGEIIFRHVFNCSNYFAGLKNRNGQVVVIKSPNQNNSYHFGGTKFFSMLLNGVASIQANGPIMEDIFLQVNCALNY